MIAAICSGCAAVLQAVGARRVRRFARVDPRLLWSLVHCRPYLFGLACNLAAFGLSTAALGSVPLFVVQALGAVNLAVVAGLARLALRQRLRWVDRVGVLAVVVGAVLLLLSARTGTAVQLDPLARWAPLAAAAGLVLMAVLIPRFGWAGVPGLLAGCSFGDSAVAARVLGAVGRSPAALATDPLAYALLAAGVLGTLLHATALQRGSVAIASGFTTVGQTIGPAAAGWFLLGDRVQPGRWPLALTGFLLAVAASVMLGRHARPALGERGRVPPVLHFGQADAEDGGQPTEIPQAEPSRQRAVPTPG